MIRVGKCDQQAGHAYEVTGQSLLDHVTEQLNGRCLLWIFAL
jgi:hypothetical protein